MPMGNAYIMPKRGGSIQGLTYVWDVGTLEWVQWDGEVTISGSISGAVTIVNGGDVNAGSTTDAAIVTNTTGTMSGKLRGIVALLADVIDLAGHYLKVQVQGAVAVTGTFWQATQPVSAASLPLPTLAATSTIQATQQTSLTSIDGKITAVNTGAVVVASSALPSGAATLAEQQTQTTDIGATNETAPATDTATSGLNGRLQRVAQRLTSLITALGSPLQAGGSIGNTTFAATQATASSLNAQVVGDVANDATDSGNPVKVGGKAVTTLPTAVTANDRVQASFDTQGRGFTRTGVEGPAGNWWNAQHNPAANNKATITHSAQASGIRNVCTGLTVSIAAGSTAPAAIQLTAALIDGNSGGTTYLWGPTVLSLPATAGATTAFVLGRCWKPGTAATAMTLEFSAAGGANTIQSVTMDGTTTTE